MNILALIYVLLTVCACETYKKVIKYCDYYWTWTTVLFITPAITFIFSGGEIIATLLVSLAAVTVYVPILSAWEEI